MFWLMRLSYDGTDFCVKRIFIQHLSLDFRIRFCQLGRKFGVTPNRQCDCVLHTLALS